MATAQMNRVLRHLRLAALAGVEMTDGELLERYVSRNDETAFEALVRRLGPMVLGVCHRVLGNSADAEDAFQATFLVLVRKATAVRPRERVGDWLHGVAYRTALKARCSAAKRRVQEAKLARTEAVPAAIPDDWRAVLDQELQRLPQKYRTAVLLCDLEGKTRKEAARQLGWADGTLSTRLARARSLLLARLSRRGVALSIAAFGTGLGQSSAAWVPPRLIAATVQAQNAVIAGTIPAKVAVLMEGVMKSMVLMKLKKCLVIIVVAAGMLGLGLGGYQALPAEEPTQKNDAKAAIQDDKGAQAAPQLDFLKRPVCHLSLSECIALALENSVSEGNAETGTGPSSRNEPNTITERIRVLAMNPGGEKVSGQMGLPFQGICLARLTADTPRTEFELRVNNLLLKTECAYWKLYQAYGSLYTYEEILRLDHKAWKIGRGNDLAGRFAQLFPIHAQYEEFGGERLKAIAAVLEAERALRSTMGISTDDGKRLVPVTEPCLARYRPHWKAAEEDALALRPELILARQKVKRPQLNFQMQKNSMRADLRFIGNYTPVSPGYGKPLDVPRQEQTGNNIFAYVWDKKFDNRAGALTPSAPLGSRRESATMRSARLDLAQAHYALLDEEERVVRALALQYQKISEWHRRIEIAGAERKAYADNLTKCSELYRVGSKGDQQGLPGVVLSLLQYHRSMALARLKEYEAIAKYNNTLARFEWVKGALSRHDNVMIEDGPLSQKMQVRAVEAERAKTRALLLKLKPTPVVHPGMLAGRDSMPTLDAE